MPLRRSSYDLLLVFTKGVQAQDAANLTHHITGDFRLETAQGLEGQTIVGVPEVGSAMMKRVRAFEADTSDKSPLQASFWNYGLPTVEVARGEAADRFVSAAAVMIISPAVS